MGAPPSRPPLNLIACESGGEGSRWMRAERKEDHLRPSYTQTPIPRALDVTPCGMSSQAPPAGLVEMAWPTPAPYHKVPPQIQRRQTDNPRPHGLCPPQGPRAGNAGETPSSRLRVPTSALPASPAPCPPCLVLPGSPPTSGTGTATVSPPPGTYSLQRQQVPSLTRERASPPAPRDRLGDHKDFSFGISGQVSPPEEGLSHGSSGE